jgi:hypothetical protein
MVRFAWFCGSFVHAFLKKYLPRLLSVRGVERGCYQYLPSPQQPRVTGDVQ